MKNQLIEHGNGIFQKRKITKPSKSGKKTIKIMETCLRQVCLLLLMSGRPTEKSDMS